VTSITISRHDLVDRLRRTLTVAGVAVALARHAVDEDGQATSTRLPVRPLVLSKVVAETAMLIRAATLAGATELRPELDELAELIAPLARDLSMITTLVMRPTQAFDVATAHIILQALGHRDDAFDRLLDEALSVSCSGPERLPNHRHEHQWLASMRASGVGTRHPTQLAATALAAPLDVLNCSTADLYVLTHLLLHATDMGRRSALLPRPVPEVLADADAGLALALAADNLDLSAELAWIWPLLGQPFSATADHALALLFSAHDRLGFLPGPEFADGGDETHVVSTSYHATIALGLLCAFALSAAPTVIDPTGSLPAITARLRSACDDIDLPRLHGLVSDAFERGAADLPVVQQAASMLKRVAIAGALAS
jgi:hypothetical protein